MDLGLTLAEFDRLAPDERSLWVARHERDQGTCPDCRRPIEECSDPKRVHYPFRKVCYPTMEREAAAAAYEELHKDAPWHDGTFKSWRKERSASHPYHFTYGVKIGTAPEDLAPDDGFTTDPNASPEKPEGEGD